MDNPDLINLFEAQNLEIPRSPREIWDLLAIIAAALFLFDVAARRITIDPRWVAMLASRAIGRRGDATTDTRFIVYSATKAFVASLMWILIGEGLVDVSKRVVDYIPEFASNGKTNHSGAYHCTIDFFRHRF